MTEKRNALIDAVRVIAAAGIILSHVDLTSFGAVGALSGQFLSVRFSLMFFLGVIGFYTEKAWLSGKKNIIQRICSLWKVYGAWSLVYLALSFVKLVLRVKDFLFSGSYYHFWFYPAVIYALLFIGLMKKLLGSRALPILVSLAAVLYSVGLLGTGYLPIGRLIPFIRTIYASEPFDTVMHVCLLGFPSIIFGMAAAHGKAERSGRMLPLAAAVYAAECVLLCLILGWRENPQMLISTPFLTVLFLRWAHSSSFAARNANPLLLRTVSAGMYHIHPLLLSVFGFILPQLHWFGTFLLCAVSSAFFGWMLYRMKNNRFFALFV